LYNSSNKYIAIVEYYNPTPVEISYRGHDDRLFKRDFAGDMMKMYPDLKLIDYGFVYHKDSNFPQDDVTWFIMKK
jgi:spore coat polysaccharide biosynthesis protein SpsF